MNDTARKATEVFLASPDENNLFFLQSLVESIGSEVHLFYCRTLEELFEQASERAEPAVVVAEVVWDNADASDVLLSLALNNPSLSVIVISESDLSQVLPEYFPLPIIQGYQNPGELARKLEAAEEDLRGQNLGPFQVQDFAGTNYLARTYSAHQPAINRRVYLNILPANATPEEQSRFVEISKAQGNNIHPSIYPIYEQAEVDGRHLQAIEPVDAPSLLQFRLRDATFDSRLIARLTTTGANVLNHLHSHKIPYQPLDATHITLSSEGVIKFKNTALPADFPIPDEKESIAALAYVILPFVPKIDFDAQVRQLLDWMAGGRATLAELVPLARSIDLALAPEKYVPQRAEQIKAAQEITKARKSSLYALLGGGAAFALLGGFLLYQFLIGFLLDIPGTDFRDMVEIPSGPVFKPDGSTVIVQRFYIDKHEVTIGQYARFLRAIEGQPVENLLPPDAPSGIKDNFVPLEWEDIMDAVTRKRLYQGEPINRNTAVFNIDYYDAYAYAKWIGKRLPTEIEWLRAASGDQNLTYPWGSQNELALTNTGVDKNAKSGEFRAGGVDGFRGAAPVNALRQDVSPFDVTAMGGNVSEWVEYSPELGEINRETGYIRGGNHEIERLVENQRRMGQPKSTRRPWLGIRCASDTFVEGRPVVPDDDLMTEEEAAAAAGTAR